MGKEKVEYPHFLSIKPYGQDFFDGKSQERIRDAIAKHIRQVDTNVAYGSTPIVSRIIGVEGKWGIGKSNVVKMLEDELNSEQYTFFTYDAWGNQEDLQRRTILELLTKQLIKNKVLRGNDYLPSFTTKHIEKDGELEFQPRTWNEKLESLHTKRSYTKETTIPSINNSTKWFVLVLIITGLLIPLMELVKPNNFPNWFLELSLEICLGPIIIFAAIMTCKNEWRNMFAMYQTGGKTETTSCVINEEEPTISEFKSWMNEISLSLGNDNKLVMVFDNMDRLSTKKVRQLWSLIHTFFADDGYKNIWCIVPFEEQHLAETFFEDNGIERQKNVRHFINKTFPIVYKIPMPILTDYKGIVYKLLKEAFGDTLDDDVLEKINKLYRIVYPEPIVREIITFINRAVSLKQEWENELNIISIVIFILQEDKMLKTHPSKPTNANDNERISMSTEDYIISKAYERPFKRELMGEEYDGVVNDLAALVYSVKPEYAEQIIMKRGIREHIINETAMPEGYIENTYFISILEEVVKEIPDDNFGKTVKFVSVIDETKLSNEDKKRLSKLWSYLGKLYIEVKLCSNNFSKYEQTLFTRVDESMRKDCAKAFCEGMVTSIEISGGEMYNPLEKLFNEPYAKNWGINEICPTHSLRPETFLNYVHSAGSDYARYPLYTDNKELNDYVISKLDGNFPYVEDLKLLKDGSAYHLSRVGNETVSRLGSNNVGIKETEELIRIQRIFFPIFQNHNLPPRYVTDLWNQAINAEASTFEEIYALAAFCGVSLQLPSDDEHIGFLKERVLFYKTTEEIFDFFSTNSSFAYLRKLIEVCVKEKIHDDNPHYEDFISRWDGIVKNTEVTYKDLAYFAESWGYNKISETEKKKSIKLILGDVNWISEIKGCDTQLSIELVQKTVTELTPQKITEFVSGSSHSNSYWDKMLKELIDTDYINGDNFGELKNLVAYLLDKIAKDGTTIKYEQWKGVIDKCPYKLISTEVVEIRDKILRGEQGYVMNPSKFLQLHIWLESAGINEQAHLADSANKILSKVINDQRCQNIIMHNANYYQPIIAIANEKSSALKTKIDGILKTDSDFAKCLEEMKRDEFPRKVNE